MRRFIENRMRFFRRMWHVQPGDDKFVDTCISIALQVIRSNWLARIGNRQFHIGTLAPVGAEQFFEALNLADRLVRRQVKAEPTVSVLGYSPQRGTAFAAEETGRAAPRTGLGNERTFSKLTNSPR
jgi:hypothetical protein